MPSRSARGLLGGGADLDVGPGELVVVHGDDGSGTSTLLRALAQAWPDAVLLDQPPGTEWERDDVAGDLADPADLAALGMRVPEKEMGTLSGGERQRVRLARVLATPPSTVLLLDEPTGYLDVLGRHVLLRRLRERTAVVVAKADPDVHAAADRLLLLADGRLLPQ
ncbi:MAG: transporter ATP-binding protein [Frankiales bacterium]|nr:transporter ATP-binding protein [Frankiales bacterium]